MASCYLYARENSSLKITLSTTVYSILYGLCLVIIDMPWIAPFRPGKKQFVCSSIFANYSNRTMLNKERSLTFVTKLTGRLDSNIRMRN